MDKGIRPYCNAKFLELNIQRVAGTLSNTAFRKSVMCDVMEQFGCTLASAATHYNHAFKEAKKIDNGALVEGLGRADDKKGGRKPKAVVNVLTPEADDQTEFTVRKKSDNSVVAEGLSFEAARALVDKAAAQKKAKLYWV